MTQTLVTPPEAGSYLVLYGVSWEMYEQLLTIFAENPTPRMTYYKGTLELMTPLPEHERYSWTLGRLITALSEELEMEICGLKSTTWRSQPKAVGKEADECFYIQNESAIRGKLEINLAVDPPPDLAIEIDLTHCSGSISILPKNLSESLSPPSLVGKGAGGVRSLEQIDTTHSSVNKMDIYAELKVPEVWRWQQGKLSLYCLTETGYVESEQSLAFGSFPVKELARFMQLDSEKGENARLREFRQWVRSQLPR